MPDDLHRTLKARAATSGKSLSEYALAELSRSASRPTVAELAERVRHRGSARPTASAAEILRAERGRRAG